MKATLVLVFFVTALASAQDPAANSAAESACGPKNVKFDAKQDSTQHPTPQPEPDKAVVYVVQEMGTEKCSACALTKIGLEGTWVGANQGSSYLFFTVQPGEHHLCLNWQSVLSTRSHTFAFATFTAEAGKVYYFRSRIFPGHYDYSFDLDPINSDQGKYLVATSPVSVSHPKK